MLVYLFFPLFVHATDIPISTFAPPYPSITDDGFAIISVSTLRSHAIGVPAPNLANRDMMAAVPSPITTNSLALARSIASSASDASLCLRRNASLKRTSSLLPYPSYTHQLREPAELPPVSERRRMLMSPSTIYSGSPTIADMPDVGRGGRAASAVPNADGKCCAGVKKVPDQGRHFEDGGYLLRTYFSSYPTVLRPSSLISNLAQHSVIGIYQSNIICI
ncbi:hypothetical protein C8J56DRAFT_897385 [Mycena floridula]|nr:hypothetical protein C8J56DRAFT_897385 [Mycena floridula]